jgi:hypothetical protein
VRTAFFAVAAVLLIAFPLSAQECSEEVVLETAPGAILMHHREALFNCCAYLEIEVTQDAFEIGIFEWEMFETTPCYCLCCFGVESTTAGLAPGDYSVSVWKVHDNCNGTWTHELVGTWLITVEGYCEPSVTSTYVPCVESAIQGEPDSWGTIKALFREGR